jgi:hypothetical protein
MKGRWDVGRREVILGAIASMVPGCDGCHEDGRTSAPSNEPPEELPPGWSDLTFPPGANCKEGERAYLLTPSDAAERPLLVALHGRGEASRGQQVGAGAWLNDYDMDRQVHRLLQPPLLSVDLEDMVTRERLAALNASLAKAPFKGVVTACPWCPDLADTSAAGASHFARFVCDDLLGKVRAVTGSKADRTRTGIDGISMGGRLALLVGLTNPDVFGVVGAMQPAVIAEEAETLSNLARNAMARAPVKLRLLTSDKDYFREGVQAVSARMRSDGVAHDLLVLTGDHGYEFNRGPGGFEMLLWHDRLAQGLSPP